MPSIGGQEVSEANLSGGGGGEHGVSGVVDSLILQHGWGHPWHPRYKDSHSLGVQQLPQLPRFAGEGTRRLRCEIGTATLAGILPEMMPMGRGIYASALENPGKVGRDLKGDGLSSSGGSGHESVV